MRRYYSPRSIRRTERKIKKNIVISIILGIGLLYFLFFWGLPTLISGLSILNKFKPLNTPEVIEDGAVAPPVLNIPFEATSSATIKISGYSSPKSKVEIYIDDSLQTTTDTNDDGSFVTDFISLNLGTNGIYGKTINEEGKKSLSSKVIRVSFNNEQPTLEVNEPADGYEVKGGDKKVRVSGKTDVNNSVSVNGLTVIVNNEGGFSTDLNLSDGDNTITIIATNSFGNTIQQERRVKYSP